MHYIDTLNKCAEAKRMYIQGLSQRFIAQHFKVDYITIWRWLQIAGITDEDKKTHKEMEVKRT
jgi:transposase